MRVAACGLNSSARFLGGDTIDVLAHSACAVEHTQSHARACHTRAPALGVRVHAHTLSLLRTLSPRVNDVGVPHCACLGTLPTAAT